jgi:hypothetical protein
VTALKLAADKSKDKEGRTLFEALSPGLYAAGANAGHSSGVFVLDKSSLAL